MTADIKLLPLPLPKGDVAGGGLDWTDEEMQDFARANMAPLIAEIEALRAAVDAVWAAMPRDARYLDPPDGGCVPLHEQVRRMAADAALAQPASDGGFTAADMMDARQEGRKEAQQTAAFNTADAPAHTQGSVEQQPAADGGFSAADMMDARQEGRKEAQQLAINGPASVTPNPDARKPTC